MKRQSLSMQRNQRLGITLILLCGLWELFQHPVSAAPRTVHASYTLHGNMNYDRYPKPIMWENFPAGYYMLLNFIRERPAFKGQMQLSGQSYKTLEKMAPDFLKASLELHRTNQLCW